MSPAVAKSGLLAEQRTAYEPALIANMLGVHRESVTEATDKLQEADLIAYHRGRIIVLYRPGLETRGCECYETVKHQYAGFLPYSCGG